MATEFKLFKEIATEPSCDLVQLVANHMRMVRTFEVKKLTSEVSKVFDLTFRENGLIKTKFTFCLTVSAESTKILTGRKTAAMAVSGCF